MTQTRGRASCEEPFPGQFPRSVPQSAGPDPVAPAIAPFARFLSRDWTWSGFAGAACIPAIWIFASPYYGIDGDARIYMGRALADLDPGGVGRDLMFALDGQSGFTIFRFVAAKLVALSNPGEAALWLAMVNMAAWFAAMVYAVTRFARGRLAGLMVVCAGVLPCPYGFLPLMSAREIVATPRPLAEALTLAALAALCEGRIIWVLAGLGAATLLHPIMALPGFGVLLLVQGWRDPRWFVAAAGGFIAIGAAAWLGVPFFARLTAVIDPAWRDALNQRNPYLFVSFWPMQSYAPLMVQAVTLTIAGGLVPGRRRLVLRAILAIGGLGIATSWLLCDGMSLLLPAQIQSWRALWIVSVFAMPALGLCLIELPRRGALSQIALAFLVLAWLTFDTLPLTPVAAGGALALVIVSRWRAPVVSHSVVLLVWLVLIALAASFKISDAGFAWRYIQSLPAVKADVFGPFWRAGLLPWPFIVCAFLWARWPVSRFQTLPALGLFVGLAALVIVSWDARTPAAQEIERAVHDPALAALTAPHPGEVLWLSHDEEWYWLGRPQWNTLTQGAGIVFSRPLAMTWLERTKFLISAGLIGEDHLRRWDHVSSSGTVQLTPEKIASVCARPDAPAWIVVPLPPGGLAPPGALLWHAPAAQADYHIEAEQFQWIVYDRYAAVACVN